MFPSWNPYNFFLFLVSRASPVDGPRPLHLRAVSTDTSDGTEGR